MSNCECDEPKGLLLDIPAGLDALPRQLRAFPEVREALLRGLATQPALAEWQARGDRDLGVMWLEMWAYVSDVLGFYDERIANESYLRTAQRRPSLRRMVELLGYIQQPGVAGSVELAVLADGRQAVTLPARTGFRSDAFDDEPPQVFEITESAVIHPLENQWELGAIKRNQVGQVTPSQVMSPGQAQASGQLNYLVFRPNDFSLARDSLLLLEIEDPDAVQGVQEFVSRVKDFKTFEAPDGNNYVEVLLEFPVSVPSTTDPGLIKVSTPAVSAVLTENAAIDPETSELIPNFSPIAPEDDDTEDGRTRITLDALYRDVRRGDALIASRPGQISGAQGSLVPEVARVQEVNEQLVVVPGVAPQAIAATIGGAPATIAGAGAEQTATANVSFDDHSHEVTVSIAPGVPPATTVVSGFTLDRKISDEDSFTISFHFNFRDAGTLTSVGDTELRTSDFNGGNALPVRGVVEKPPGTNGAGQLEVQPLLLRDKDGAGALTQGVMSFSSTGTATFTKSTTEGASNDALPSFRSPVTIFGNVISATRGETVFNEVLGSGDPRVVNQAFSLRKKPLTYLPAPTLPRGIRSTLVLRVNGVQWREVKSFFGCGPEDEVFIVRHDDDQNTLITFGDGVRGARVPAGVDNVVATYRFGSGSKVPPAGAIEQIARPVEGLGAVTSPVAAKAGRDPDNPDALRTTAPRQLLTLGRLVSVQDYEALAQLETGVLRAQAEFVWLNDEQRAGVKVLWIGSADNEAVRRRLSENADPNLGLEVAPAIRSHSTLFPTIVVDDRYVASEVESAVVAALADEQDGLLAPRHASIGGQLWSSQVYEAIYSVPGVLDVSAVTMVSSHIGWFNLAEDDVICIPPGIFLNFGFGTGGVSPTTTVATGTVTSKRRRVGAH